MSSNFGKLARNTVAFQSLAGNAKVSAGVELKPLNEICARFNNKYINNADKAKSLEMSIRENGLIEPIVVISIDEYLSKGNASEEERSYLNKYKSNGVKYFISSGHRRFKAYVSIAINKTVLTTEDLSNFYDDFNVLYKEYLDEREYAMMNGEEIPDGKWFQIPCKVTSLDEIDESAIYNDSNTTQRELTGFELVVNAVDELNKSGELAVKLEEAKIGKINSLKERALRTYYTDLKEKKIISPVDISSDEKKVNLYREALYSAPASEIAGLEGEINQYISDYILEKKQRVVSKSNVNYARKILEVFDEEVIQCIYDGLLTYKDARILLSSYNKIDKTDLLNSIKSKNFNVEDFLQTEGKKKEVKYSSSELIEMIYDIKNGKKTVDEIIKIIEGR